VKFWHRHKWEVESAHHTPALARMGVRLNVDAYGETLRALTEGRTNIYLRCVECGLIRSESVYGKYEPPVRANAVKPLNVPEG
jgi:hypothetical protein